MPRRDEWLLKPTAGEDRSALSQEWFDWAKKLQASETATETEQYAALARPNSGCNRRSRI